MKNLHLLRANSWPRFGISRVSTFWVRFYSRKATAASSYPGPNDSLLRRITRSGHPSTSMAAILDKWLEEGKHVKQFELQRFIRQLRTFRRFSHALQVSEWMSDQRNNNLPPTDIAVQLDLISKVRGLEQAENYFNSVPDDLRTFHVYGALLNCYATNKSLEKAEAVMQKLRGLGFVKTFLPYNAMLNLYFQHGKYENMDILMEEMKGKGINGNIYTYNIRLNAYGAASDFEGMEKLLMKMEADPHFNMNWRAYVVAGNWYLKDGLIEKSVAMLKKSEHLISSGVKHVAYEILLTLYATARKKDEVYRIWNLYKNLGKIKNAGYLCMISALVKLDDFDSAERIFEEWENEHTLFDYRLPNIMISTYCRKGLLEKAETYVNRLIKIGKEPDASSWDHLASGYRVLGQMAKSVEILKRAILASATRPRWKPNRFTLAACLEYLRHEGEMEAAEELLKLLREHGLSSEDVYDRLGSDINNESPGPLAVDQIAEGETEEIVGFEDEGRS